MSVLNTNERRAGPFLGNGSNEWTQQQGNSEYNTAAFTYFSAIKGTIMKILLALILFISVPILAEQANPDIVSAGIYQVTLTNTTPLPIPISKQYAPPYTLTLSFANNTGRLIELSSDGGTTWFTPAYDVSTGTSSTAGIFVVSVGTSITHVRFTGASGDVCTIL